MQNNQPKSEIIIYQNEASEVKIDVRLENDTVWLTQAQLVDLYQSSKSNISEHIKHIYEEGELDRNSTVRNFRTVATNDKSYEMEYYNLDVIISLGYRIKSRIATNFRIWATERLNEYIRKGFTMNDDFLKENGGGKYWYELLDRIRDIRSSEKIFYRQILDIYATSIDYDAKAKTSLEFFKKVQNKVHFAVHQHTAAEIIYNRADAEKEFMGLTTFQGTRPHLTDAVIAKNYLNERELRALGQIVSGHLDFAERQTELEASKKQYEHYRNQLLTFKELT